MKTTEIKQRIASLRILMKEKHADAYLITGADPHLSEYTPDNWKTREWISGFTGSYGKVLVTMENVLLWTDTRYFIQAEQELEGTDIVLMKDRIPEAISIEDWIISHFKDGSHVFTDGSTISAGEVNQITNQLGAKGILFDADLDLVDEIWVNRPILPVQQCFEHSEVFACQSRRHKIGLVREMLLKGNFDSTIISQLDDLAWLFNLRSAEILYTPVVTAFGYLSHNEVYLFIDPAKLSSDLKNNLEKDDIILRPYDSFYSFLSGITSQRIQFDPLRTNARIHNHLFSQNHLQPSVSIISNLKAVKSRGEIENIKNAHIKDGAALVHSLYWINHNLDKEIITEVSFGNKLNEFRSFQKYFMGDSFHPIVGFGSHGAIVHYHATSDSDFVLKRDNLLLIDSGGQYLDGTTDLTRTIALGSVTQKQKEDFTVCLKGHIALATAIFPEGTKGYSLDPLARKHLWDKGINYGHGTGHGIGYYLSVHEGPMSIRAEFNNEPIREGHLLSNEPGIYRPDEYGIRIENVLLCKRHSTTEFGSFLDFETISYCPIDRNLIIKEHLNSDEIKWLNTYHETVYNKISPLIEEFDVREWLREQCAPIKNS